MATIARIISGRGNIVFGGVSNGPKDYSSALKSMDRSFLKKAYDVIEDHLDRADEYTLNGCSTKLCGCISEYNCREIREECRSMKQLLTEIKAADQMKVQMKKKLSVQL